MMAGVAKLFSQGGNNLEDWRATRQTAAAGGGSQSEVGYRITGWE
jgi:hypothetical protein